MKLLFLSVVFLVQMAFQEREDFYSISIKDIRGNTVNLKTFKGKKIMFAILPFRDIDSTLINKVTDFQNDNHDSLVVLGILTNELGYSNVHKQSVIKQYEEIRNSGIVLTEGMNITSGQTQSLIIKWLTDKEKNGHFGKQVTEIGQKFFVDEKGKLYAVISPEVSFNNAIFKKVLSKPIDK